MDNTKLLDIIAYYLSEYDLNAVSKLGYTSRNEAFQKISVLFGKKGNYLKRLRDEYDVVTSSTRRGQCNRSPRKRIVETTTHLKGFSFDEITEIITAIIENASNSQPVNIDDLAVPEYSTCDLTEEEIEHIINFKDSDAGIKITDGQTAKRVYNTSIIKQLKRLYKGNCQICACNPVNTHSVDISEVHHINYFSVSHNNDSDNLIVLCPNHHRLIHKLNPVFNSTTHSFVLADGSKLKIALDYHLGAE